MYDGLSARPGMTGTDNHSIITTICFAGSWSSYPLAWVYSRIRMCALYHDEAEPDITTSLWKLHHHIDDEESNFLLDPALPITSWPHSKDHLRYALYRRFWYHCTVALLTAP
jgi:hypothetical protein